MALATQPPPIGSSEPPAEAGAGIALRGTGLSFRYAGGGAPVFEDVSIAIDAREIVALLGGSGCGKSTLLRTLAGLQPPTQGAVEFLGAPLTAPHPRAAVVFQQASLLPWLNVAANTAFGLDFKHQPAIDAATLRGRVQTCLAAVGLQGSERLYPAALSGGMAQRVALARALAREPRLLLADEPFSALDAITRTGMQDLLVELVHRWHTAALLVTHDIDEAILVADRIVLMGPRGGVAGQPGTLVREWRVDIPRPRHAHPAATTALRLDILAALHDTHVVAQAL
ncbi:ABC transporter ATP-binding protein [Paracidovorax wautersii]|uniref:NitT/TauT family transport system ATP-binding protein n=1 Tax=Paracidovorax wautersii TaxID=1177982 RepID=A0ABU1I7V8_9BURK|nr:ABC transporter ATP-binding protein [Paracidovorax wautersii]MDR6213066.1 NitT/TauT family transport system ATP-binding protein [Paracidovorax wautersii]